MKRTAVQTILSKNNALLVFIKNLRHDFFLCFLAMFAFLLFVPVFTYAYFNDDLATQEGIMNRNNTGVILLDRYNRPFFSLYEAQKKTFFPVDQIPEHLQQAVIAIEDREFYSHIGFSVRGIVRSAIQDIQNKNLESGGSTITQQLVKNSLLNPQKNFLRKYQEILLAYEIERKYPKNEILEMYLNSVYFGEGAFGVEEASKVYFGKSVREVTLAEASILAALLPAPSRLSPYDGDKEELFKRQKIVLQKMYEQGYISAEEKEHTEKELITFVSADDTVNSYGLHFALMVRDQLINQYGEEEIARSGYKVRTTLNLDWQKYAEEQVSDHVRKLVSNKVTNGSAVVIDAKTGAIRALIGSKNWHDDSFGKVNVATALRQPGSAFKPVVYAAALERSIITPATILQDNPKTYGGTNGSEIYQPRNYDGRFRGSVLVRRALANSLNVPAVEVINKLGITHAIEMANRLGITSLQDPSQYGLSLALGAGEVSLMSLTNAYATFANNGTYNEVVSILEITNKQNKTIFSHKQNPKNVLDAKYAFLISSILSDKQARREMFGTALDSSVVAAVKTGTTENYKDAWTVGYTPDTVVGVWVGNNDGTSMDSIAGSLGAAPIWKNLIEKFSEGKSANNFDPPEGIAPFRICGNGGVAQDASSSGSLEYFVIGTEPKIPCYIPKPQSNPTQTPETQNDIQPKDHKDREAVLHQLKELGIEIHGDLVNAEIAVHTP